MSDLRPAAIPLLVWSAFLGLSTLLQILLGGKLLPVLLLGGAAALIALIAAAVLIAARWAREPRVSPQRSGASVLLAVGLCAVLCGASVGGWLVIGGCGVALAGSALLARELRAERRPGR